MVIDEAGRPEDMAGNDDRMSKEEIFTKIVRAGKRTYFFDVKATRKEDYYLTITESKKRVGKEGKFFYEKHKIFLYKEDFEKFAEGLREAIDYIAAGQESGELKAFPDSADINPEPELVKEEFTNVDFEDLG